MNPKDFAAIAIQTAANAAASVAPTSAAHMQMAQWLGVVEALAQGRLTITPINQEKPNEN